MINGLYLTSQDNESFNDAISKRIISYNKVNQYDITSSNNHKQHCQNITFVVTESCNLNCTYCYETHKTNKVMTKETAKEAVDFILDKDKINGYYDTDFCNAVILDFIGGEPFLNIDVIDFTVEYFKAKTLELNHPWAENYMISITTNGTLNFDKKVQDFIERNKARLSLGITIDGNKELHDKCRLFYDGRGSYDLAEKAILDWKKYNPNLDTKVTLAPENIEYLLDAQKNLIDLGVVFSFTNCCFEEGWNIEHARILYQKMKELSDYIIDNELYTRFYCSLFNEHIGFPLKDTQNWCGGNGDMLAIGTDGTCYSCIRFMQYSLNNQEEKSIGDIYKGLDSPKTNCWLCALQKIDMISQCQHEDNRKCLDCSIAQGCALCTGFNYDVYGDPNHKATFICDMHRARVLANVYFWNKLYRKLNLKKRFNIYLDDETALTIIDKKELDYLKSIEKEV